MRKLLVVNSGSSSIKLALFDENLAACGAASVTEIGGLAALCDPSGNVQTCVAPDHVHALALGLRSLNAMVGLDLAAHRVVHGGETLVSPCRVTPAVQAEIAALAPLAPLHNPHNLAAIKALANLAPDLPQYASFDTAFHASNPDVASRYAVPEAVRAMGVRRYGFHGLSYASLVERLPIVTGKPLPQRLLALHLGNGASLCAIRGGVSVATTMGYSPLDGLNMGTRSGSIDGNAVLRLAEVFGIDHAARILNRESGLLGLGGASDMRRLHRMDTQESRFAIAHFCYWITRHAGSMIAAMGGLDAIVFTGGIGENDPYVRSEVVRALEWAGVVLDISANAKGAQTLHQSNSRVAVWTVNAQEERHIAAEALEIASRGAP